MVRTILPAILLLAGLASAATVSTSGSCGAAAGNATCQGSAFGNCCSPYGYCGGTAAFCGPGCDPKFGTCDAASGGTNGNISTDGTCGGATASGSGSSGRTCKGSAFGGCCSRYGFCGDADAFCGGGCQAGFGSCSSSPADAKVTQDGSCGKDHGGTTCAGAGFGGCCSAYGYCGSTSLYCGQGCDPKYGTCSSGSSSASKSSTASAGATPASTTSSAPASPTVKTTPDGTCGGGNGYSCPVGQCCSKNGWCGTTDDFCSFGCKPAFGSCQACPGPACGSTVSGGSPSCGGGDVSAQDGGKCFVQGGKKFMVNCDGKTASGDWVDGGDTSSISTLAGCVAACARTAGCVVANMYTGMGQKSCSLLGSFSGRQTSSGAVGHFAYVKNSACP